MRPNLYYHIIIFEIMIIILINHVALFKSDEKYHLFKYKFERYKFHRLMLCAYNEK